MKMAASYLDKVVRARGLNGFNKGDGVVVVSRMNINNAVKNWFVKDNGSRL